MRHLGRVAVIAAPLLLLCISCALAQGNRGITNESVTPTGVAPGDSIWIYFEYTIWNTGPMNAPWEVRLDGTPGARDGVLLVAGSQRYSRTDGTWQTLKARPVAEVPLDTAPGTHTVKMIASADANFAAAVAYAYVDLTVTSDGAPPVADAGPDQTVEQESAAGTEVTLDGSRSVGAETYTWEEDDGPIAEGATPSVTLPLGVHTLTLTVSNSAGSDSDECVITVQDTTPPELTCPADMVVQQQDVNGAVVQFACTATDICDAEVGVVCTPASGSVFPPGATQVACVATDHSGNSATGSFTVTVQDTTPPVLVCPVAIVREQSEAAGAKVEFQCTATDDCDPDPEVVCTPPSGSVFPLGTTEVQVVATDDAGNRATGSFTVTVMDTVAPVVTISSPEAKAYASTDAPIPVQYTFTDACDAEPDVVVTLDGQPAGGSINPGALAKGDHTLTVTATDDSGNVGEASVAFSIEAPELPSFQIEEFLIEWQRGDDRFTVVGRFTLPDGVTADNLAAIAVLHLGVAGQTATDRVVLQRWGLIWSYWGRRGRDDSLGQGMDIDSMQIVFPPRRHGGGWSGAHALCNGGGRHNDEAWFVASGRLTLSGLDVSSRPATGSVSLALPLSTSGASGGLNGSQEVPFRVCKAARLWWYRR